MAAPIGDISTLFSLSGKTAIVTGGTGGLGLAMTMALASGGADIISIELPSDPGSEALKSAVAQTNRNFKSYHCDVRDPKSLRGIYQTIWNDGVKGDILLNCAGVQRRAEAEDFTDEDIELVLDVNLKAILISCQEFAKPLLKEGRPRMTGVMQLTKAFSNEWAGRGIQVNSIHPGYFRTPLTEQYSTDPKYKDFNDYIMSRTPAKRWGEPKDLAGAVIFLASPASDYVSGTGTVVDGGFMGF